VVFGGDGIAQQKVEGLLAAGARVTVISATLNDGLAALAETHEVLHHARGYQRGDLADAVLAFAAIDDPDVHAAMAAEAAAARVLLNVVDQPRFCSFIAPAVVSRGAVSIAISTSGASPALAKRLRKDLEQAIGPEYGVAATLLGKLRPLLAASEPDSGARARVFAALLDAPLLEALRARDTAAVNAILGRVVGTETTLARLGIHLDESATVRPD
jgi:siroheme synthase-like protein